MDQNNSGITEDDDFSGMFSNGNDDDERVESLTKKIQELESELSGMRNKVNAASNSAGNSNEFGPMMTLQIGQKFGKMEIDVVELKGKSKELKKENEKFKERLKGLEGGIAGIRKEFPGDTKKLDEAIGGMEKKIGELEEKMEKKDGTMEGIEKKMEQMMEELAKQKENLKGGIEGVKEEFGRKYFTLERKIVENHLEKAAQINMLNGMIESLQNAISLMGEKQEQMETANAELADSLGQIDKLSGEVELLKLAITKFTASAMEVNKWNPMDRSQKITISGYGLVANSIGQNGDCSVRAVLPIQKFVLNGKIQIVNFYFETYFVKMANHSIGIGLMDRHYPLNSVVGGNNSIAIWSKGGLKIDGQFVEFQQKGIDGYFKVGDTVGIGLVHSVANATIKCFASLNGTLLGFVELPKKFEHVQLYPAASFYHDDDSIRVNFGKEGWKYNPSQLVQ